MTEPRFSDDPVQHRARKELLVKLAANNRNPAVAELASELLTGKVTPRRIVESTLYSNVLEGATNDFATWYSGLSDEEKDAAAARGEQTARDLADTPKPVQQRRSEDDEDFSDRSWLRG